MDRESAYERLKGRAEQPAPAGAAQEQPWYSSLPSLSSLGFPSGGGGGRRGDSVMEAATKSAARAIGSTVGRQIVRGVLGSLLGGSKR